MYLYFLGLSFRNTAKALQRFVKRSHVSIWKWIQKYRPKKISSTKTKVSEFIIDETLIKVGSELIWLWVAIEPIHRQILHIDISFERNMFVAERFIASLINTYGTHPISTDGGKWYPQACQFLKLDHHIHSFYEKSLIERTIQYIKNRTECFDDYFPCKRKKKCKLKHLKQWLYLFIHQHNREILS
ncbi:MAG: DDE-type integrase/transposase/recombinase [Candidatus Nitrosocosmicus sp.]